MFVDTNRVLGVRENQDGGVFVLEHLKCKVYVIMSMRNLFVLLLIK